MKKFKIRVKNPEHSEKIQNKLFEMGYFWGGKGGKIIQHKDVRFLYVNSFGDSLITLSEYYEGEYFNRHPLPEVELIEKISYEFKEIPKRNVVKIGELSYYEDELSEALKNIKPIN